MLLKQLRSQRGFTMIELLTVIVIIGVLMTISMIAYGRARDRSLLARVKSNVGEIELALDDYQRDHNGLFPALKTYHNSLPPSGSLDTIPAPPPDPAQGTPSVLTRKGNSIIGGGPGLVDTGNPLQDDFYSDSNDLFVSFFRDRMGEAQFGEPMNPVDELALNGQFQAYPQNPLKSPGIPMVNIAYMLYDYDRQTNDFRWVDMTVNASGDVRTGLCAARPAPGGVYEPIDPIWDDASYPQGDFAYIPFDLQNEQGKYCRGFWIISYGDLTTLQNSEWTKYSNSPEYANWPNLPQPYGDGIADTPPVTGTVEFEIKRLMYGALDVRANIYQDQLQVIQK